MNFHIFYDILIKRPSMEVYHLYGFFENGSRVLACTGKPINSYVAYRGIPTDLSTESICPSCKLLLIAVSLGE